MICSGNQSKANNMYKSETITRADGTKYVQCTRLPKTEHETWLELIRLLDQEQTARAIEEFGSSA